MTVHPLPQSDLTYNFGVACRVLAELILERTPTNLTRILYDLPNLLGVKHVAYVELEKDATPDVAMFSVYSTYPKEWQLRYVARGYAAVDPIFAACFELPVIFDWSSISAKSQQLAPFFADAASYGIGENGYTIRVPIGPTTNGMMSFNSDLKGKDWQAFLHRYVRNLEVVACLVANAARQNNKLPSKAIDLSKREHEALSWAARGRTASEIGDIMGVSYATARSHLESARRRLNCENVTHAVATALAIGLIPPIALRGFDPIGFSGKDEASEAAEA